MKQLHRYQTLRRFAACAGLFCALALPAGGPALGQENPPPAAPPKASPAAPALPDQAEKRIADLRARLGITPAQEKAWEDLAKVMRENAVKMKALLDKWSQEQAAMTAIQSLNWHRDMAEEHYQALRRLIPPFEALYKTMSPDQQATADKVFSTHEGRSGRKRK